MWGGSSNVCGGESILGGSVWQWKCVGWECVVVIVLDEGVGMVGVSEQIGIDLWWE